MLCNNIAIEVDGKEIKTDKIKEYLKISVSLAYVNSTCMPAEIIDVSSHDLDIEKWVNDRNEFGRAPVFPIVNRTPTPDFNASQPYGSQGDIEIIDLDDPRRDIKPTTWHLN